MGVDKIVPYYQEDGITLYCGDCREILPQFPDKSFDLVLTDPPYGNETEYDNFDDTKTTLKNLIKITIPEIIRVGRIGLITSGVGNLWSYPEPNWTLSWITPAGAGSSVWGFSCWQPILAYGKDPYLTNGLGRRSDTIIQTEISEKNGHPCPKPIGVWKKVLLRGSVKNTDIILDPFCGSGTTLVAAKQLGRKAVGIEISEKYCKITIDRLRQKELF
jgi:site-specific DNA-methyltransferase (adenine-specific)